MRLLVADGMPLGGAVLRMIMLDVRPVDVLLQHRGRGLGGIKGVDASAKEFQLDTQSSYKEEKVA